LCDSSNLWSTESTLKDKDLTSCTVLLKKRNDEALMVVGVTFRLEFRVFESSRVGAIRGTQHSGLFKRTREGSRHSSARTLSAKPERLEVQDRLRYNDRHVLDRLGHQRQSAFDRLSKTYSPSTTKSRQDRTSSKDHPHGRSCPHMLDTSNKGRPENMERFRSVRESYDDSHSHSYHDRDRSRHMKRRRASESPLSSVSRSDSSDGRYQKSKSKRHKPTDEDDLTMPRMCEEGALECMRISRFMHGINNPKLTKRLNEHVPKTMEEMMNTTTAFIRGEAAAASKKKGHASWRTHDQSKRQTSKKRTDFRGKFQPPPPMVTPVEKRSSNKFCDFYNDKRHSTNECMQLKKQIEELVRVGKLSHLIKEIKHGQDQSKVGKKETPAKDKLAAIYMIQSWQRMTKQKLTQSFERVREIMFPPLATSSGAEGSFVIEAEIIGHMIHRMYVDGGSSMEILYEQ
nr:hypothetical protein [Tanacetum cinerariifolium]